jgi:arylsulfatase A-like enzyme
MFDGYDTGVRLADLHIGRVLDELRAQDVLDDTAIVFTSDHGENLGEANGYMTHMTADAATVRVPMIVRWPGVTQPRQHDGLVYSIDVTATVTGVLGREPSPYWDSRPFVEEFRRNHEWGREYLVSSNIAGVCQRTVRFGPYFYIRTYHDGFGAIPDVQLFDVASDFHQTRDLAPTRPDLVGQAAHYLTEWEAEMMRTATYPADPLWTLVNAGGAEHVRGYLPLYCRYLRSTGRAGAAEYLEKKHPARKTSHASMPDPF